MLLAVVLLFLPRGCRLRRLAAVFGCSVGARMLAQFGCNRLLFPVLNHPSFSILALKSATLANALEVQTINSSNLRLVSRGESVVTAEFRSCSPDDPRELGTFS